jgi:acid phosphatase family membrane protein YuiD
MPDLFQNKVLWITLGVTLLAQFLKVLLVLLIDRKVDIKRMTETGGMPSSHSAAVSCLAISMGLTRGFDSAYFTISAVLAIIVIYDATGIRQAAGKHAEILNEITRELADLIEHGYQPQTLKTLLGHTYPQAIAGIILGVSAAFTFFR